MTTNKNDLRWQRTTAKLRAALVGELKERPLDQVTVASIVKRAKVSRRTFYLHYIDKYDFLNQEEDRIIDKLTLAMQKDHDHFVQLADGDQALWQQSYFAFDNVLVAIDDERALLRVLLDRGTGTFFDRLAGILREEINTRMALFHADYRSTMPRRYAEVIVVDQLLDLTVAWLRNPHPESVHTFAKVLADSRLVAPLHLLTTGSTGPSAN